MTLELSSAPVVCSPTRWITLGWNSTHGLFFPPAQSARALLCLDKDEKVLTWEKKYGVEGFFYCYYLLLCEISKQKASSGTRHQELQVDTDVLI